MKENIKLTHSQYDGGHSSPISNSLLTSKDVILTMTFNNYKTQGSKSS